MATRDDYVKYLSESIDEIPRKYKEKNLQMAYQQGVLLSILADTMMRDNLALSVFKQAIQKLKEQE